MTRHDRQSPEIVTIELSQLEGRELFAFLDTLIAKEARKSNVAALEAAQDMLGGANALALWLRENVVLDLRADEAAEVLEALLASLSDDRTPQEAHAPLAAVRDKLNNSLSGSLVAGIIGKGP
jgi:hypothetical protein